MDYTAKYFVKMKFMKMREIEALRGCDRVCEDIRN